MVIPRVIFAAALLLSGCRTTVPINVWQPAELESAVGKRVAVSTVVGPTEIAEPIRAKMISLAPSDAGRQILALDPATLPDQQAVRLVSATDEVNDLAVASLARRDGIDYVLRGQVLSRRVAKESEFDPGVPLVLSWRLMSVADDRHAGGRPVVVDLNIANKIYPDLAMVTDPTEAMAIAAVRETYRLLAPSIRRQEVQLAVSYGLPGSKDVRRGNAMAMSGRWGEAELVWRQTLDQHPTQTAALHNLALAVAAGQDFSTAKSLARQAIRRQPTPLYKQTLVWIEQRQREYHRAFDLPDPPEGWFVTHD